MPTYTLRRDGDRDLVFDGELIGEASSRRGNAGRWFEAKIYRTEGGAYVVSGAGRTEIRGETDRLWAVVCHEANEVVEALQRDELKCAVCDNDFASASGPCEDCGAHDRVPTGVRFLTKTAREALDQAAEADTEIRDAFAQRVA